MLAVILGSGMVFLDTTVVNVALPRIVADLPSRMFGALEAQAYVYYGYLLALASLLVLGGALGDRHGRRRMFALGLAGFGITSLLCGVAPGLLSLNLFRLLQGATGALLVPGSLALLRANFSGAAQGRAFGLWAAASAITTILGPLVGGLLVQTVSWRAVFLLNVPFAALAIYATQRHVPESRDEGASGRFDWTGAGLVAVGVGGLVWGAIRGQQTRWAEPWAFVALAIGAVVCLLVVPLWMKRVPSPLVPLDLFRSRNFTVANVSTVLLYGGLYVTFYYLAIHLQGTLGYSPAAAGLALTPSTLLVAALSSRMGEASARLGPRLFLGAGPFLMAAGLLWLARLPVDSAPWRFGFQAGQSLLPPRDFLVHLLPGQIVFGVGLAILVAPLTNTVMSSVSPDRAGLASAINNALSRLGPQLVGAITFVFVTQRFYAALARQVPSLDVGDPAVRQTLSPLNPPAAEVSPAVDLATRVSSGAAFATGLAIAAVLVLVGGVVNAIGIRNPPAEPHGREARARAEPVPG